MPIINGYWNPPLSPKQAQLVNSRSRYLLASGPKRSGKSLGNLHRMVKLAFETDRARWAVFSKTIKEAKEGGVWSDLTDIVLPDWLNANIGMDLVTPPKVDGQSRQLYLEISNRHGNRSRIALNSLDYDGDVEKVAKGKRYSGVYFSELSKFKTRNVFDITVDTLRCVHLKYEDHYWMADTNPADEGEESWIWKLWYEERCREDHEDPAFRNDLGLIEIMIPDNPFLTQREIDNLNATFRHDPDLYNRYILGKWTTATSDSHFSDVFKPEIHIVGDASGPKEEDWEVLLPEENCTALITGSDIGSINHSFHIIEPAKLADGPPIYKVLDEVVILGEKVSLADVVEQWIERMRFWERVIGGPIQWRHWSDKSAFDSYRPQAELYDYQFVYKASGGYITLQAAPKFNESVRSRVDTVRRLLFADRLLISARCKQAITMLNSLKKGTTSSKFVDRQSIFKHAFDSLSYALLAEAPIDLVPPAPEPRSGRIVLVQ